MYEKYLKDLIEVNDKNTINDKYNVLFKYDLKDAIGMPIKSIIVTNSNNDNLYLISSNQEKKYHIDVAKIIKIIEKHVDQFDSIKDKEIPKQPIMDGYINTVDFKANDKWYNLKFTNLGYYSDEEIDKSEYLSLVFDLLNDLYDELESQAKEVKDYFVLTYEDEEE